MAHALANEVAIHLAIHRSHAIGVSLLTICVHHMLLHDSSSHVWTILVGHEKRLEVDDLVLQLGDLA